MTEVCLSFDFDAFSLWMNTLKQATATPLSRGEFSANVGIVRVLRLLEEKGVLATFFVPAHTAISFKDVTKQIVDAGHEIGLHGDCHETPVGLSRADEARVLDRSIARLREVLGPHYAPFGYRSPAWDLSANSLELLEERGLLYDSSMMADDYRPYRARLCDIVDGSGFHRGRPSRIVELPVAWELDDFPYFCFLNRPLYQGLRSTDEVFHLWREEFDCCHAAGDGVFTLTMHPEIIGRGPRIAMLGRLIDYMAARADVRFRVMADVARDRAETL